MDAETKRPQSSVDGVDGVGNGRHEFIFYVVLRQSSNVGGRGIETGTIYSPLGVTARLEKHGNIIASCLWSSSVNIRSSNMAVAKQTMTSLT